MLLGAVVVAAGVRRTIRDSATATPHPYADRPPEQHPYADPPPPPEQHPYAGLVSLVGSRISCHGTVFTVLDDSAPAMDNVRRAGGRAVVTASDAAGQVGLLFVGFDVAGALIEAKTQHHQDWAPAQFIG